MYSKDYFTGMLDLTDAIKYELARKCKYWKIKALKCNDIDTCKDYINIADGIETATKIVDNVLTMQLEVKGEQDKVEEVTSEQALAAANILNIYCNDAPNNNCEEIKCSLYQWCVKGE